MELFNKKVVSLHRIYKQRQTKSCVIQIRWLMLLAWVVNWKKTVFDMYNRTRHIVNDMFLTS